MTLKKHSVIQFGHRQGIQRRIGQSPGGDKVFWPGKNLNGRSELGDFSLVFYNIFYILLLLYMFDI